MSQFIQITPWGTRGYFVEGPEGMKEYFGASKGEEAAMMKHIRKNKQYLHNPITGERDPTEGTEVE